MTEPAARFRVVPALIASGLGASLALHLVEPALPITWSYAHLGRRPELRPLALVLALVLPLAAVWLRRRPGWDAPVRMPSAVAVVGFGLAIGLAVWILGGLGTPPTIPAGRALSQARDFYEDKRFFVASVNDGDLYIARWHLTLWTLHRVVGLILDLPMRSDVPVPVADVAYRVSQVVGVIALAALGLAARALAATRGEAIAIWLLAATSFGTLEIAAGYIDVYPVAVAGLCLYLWTAVRAARGELHPAWPLAIAAMGPFWYEGLLLLAPSAVLLAALVATRPGGLRALAIAALVALALTGVATIPVYGAPFAWRTFVADVTAHNAMDMGYSPTTSLVPWAYFATALHAREVLHTMLLIDGTGVLLVLVLGVGLFRRPFGEPALLVVAAVVAPYLAYVLWMDPVYGAFADWDLFCWGAPATSLLGAALLVRWSRKRSPAVAALVGLALAANLVHLLARFHALDVAAPQHLLESPRHVPG